MLVLDNQVMEETEMYLDQDDCSDSPFEVEEVKQAIMRLPAGFRKVLVLYLIEGYDHVEISEILSISISTSKSQYMRAKVKLRSILNEKKHE
jgi:RNA polymerase sigma factor (sigma-70 family)